MTTTLDSNTLVSQDLLRVQIGLDSWKNAQNLEVSETTGSSTALQGFLDTLQNDMTINMTTKAGVNADLADLVTAVQKAATDPTQLTAAQNALGKLETAVGIVAADPTQMGLLAYVTLSSLTIFTMQQDMSKSVLDSVFAASGQKQQLSALMAALQKQRPADASAPPTQFAPTRQGTNDILLQMMSLGLIDTLTPTYLGPGSWAVGQPQYLGLVPGQDKTKGSSYLISDVNGDGVWDMTQAGYDTYISQIQTLMSTTDQSQQQDMTKQAAHSTLATSIVDFLSKMMAMLAKNVQGILDTMR